MSALDDAITKGNAKLNDLLALQNKALDAHDHAKQKSLQGAIEDLTFQLGRLNGIAIANDDAKIGSLNAQLDKVTQAAATAMNNLAKVEAVVGDVAAIASIVDGIVAIAVKVG
jgi:hypothetical protein